MSKLKLKINVKVAQLLCIIVSVALNGEFERFGGFCVDFFSSLYEEKTRIQKNRLNQFKSVK